MGPHFRKELRPKFLYDSQNLYLGIYCQDAEPDQIIAHQFNRNASNAPWFQATRGVPCVQLGRGCA